MPKNRPPNENDKTFREMAHQPKFKRTFEKLLRLACFKGDWEQVAERLGWEIDPNSTSKWGRTPLIVNVRNASPSSRVVQALLQAGADPSIADHRGLTALDYARRKLAKIDLRPRKPPPKSKSLDENNNLVLPKFEQEALENMRRSDPELGPEMARMYLKERIKAARKVFNDPVEIEKIVVMLENAERTKS